VSSEQCVGMIEAILERSRKNIDDSYCLKDELTSHSGRANPLFITIFMKELILFRGHQLSKGEYKHQLSHGVCEQLKARVTELRQAQDIVALLEMVLCRLKRAYLLPPSLATEVDTRELICLRQKKSVSRLSIGPVDVKIRCIELLSPRKDPMEPGSMILLPGETNLSLVVKMISESKFGLIHSGHPVQWSQLSPEGDKDVYLLKASLVYRVLSFIWASKEGLRISEILDLLNHDQ